MPITRHQIPTPALTLDLDKFESNLARLAREVKAAGKKLRPHFKAHKCVEIARIHRECIEIRKLFDLLYRPHVLDQRLIGSHHFHAMADRARLSKDLCE